MSVLSDWQKSKRVLEKMAIIERKKRDALLERFAFILRTVYPYKDEVVFTDYTCTKKCLLWSEKYIPDIFNDYCDQLYEKKGWIVFCHSCNVDSASCPTDYEVKIPIGLFDLTEEEIIRIGKSHLENREQRQIKAKKQRIENAKENRRELYESLKKEFECSEYDLK